MQKKSLDICEVSRLIDNWWVLVSFIERFQPQSKQDLEAWYEARKSIDALRESESELALLLESRGPLSHS